MPQAEQGFGGRRSEQHGAVAAVPRDDVGNIARQQPIAVLLRIEEPEACPRQRFGAEREAGRVKPRRDDAERRQRLGRDRSPAAAIHVRRPASTRSPTAASAKVEAVATTRRDAESDASSGTTTSQMAANDAMPPVVRRQRRDQSGQRQRRQDMRAFVAAGARQKICAQNRRDEPGEYQEFDHARRAANEQIDRKRRQRDHAAEQARRDKGTMPRRRQHILPRRRMNQRLDIIAYWREQAHVPDARPLRETRSPFSVARIVSEAA